MVQDAFSTNNLPSIVKDSLLHLNKLNEVIEKKKININKYRELVAKLPARIQRTDQTLPNPPLPESLRANKETYTTIYETDFEGFKYKTGQDFSLIVKTDLSTNRQLNAVSGKILGIFRYVIKSRNKIVTEHLLSLGSGDNAKVESVFYLRDFAFVHQASQNFVDLLTKPKIVNTFTYGNNFYQKSYVTGNEIYFLEPLSNKLVRGKITKIYQSAFENENEIVIDYQKERMNYSETYLIKYFFEEIPELIEKEFVVRNDLKLGDQILLDSSFLKKRNEINFREAVVENFFRKGAEAFLVRFYFTDDPEKNFQILELNEFREKTLTKNESFSLDEHQYNSNDTFSLPLDGVRTKIRILGLFSPFFTDVSEKQFVAFMDEKQKIYTMPPTDFHHNIQYEKNIITHEHELTKIPEKLIFAELKVYFALKDSFSERKMMFNSSFNRGKNKKIETPYGKLFLTQIREKNQDNTFVISDRSLLINVTDTNSSFLVNKVAEVFSTKLLSLYEDFSDPEITTEQLLPELSIAINNAHKDLARHIQQNLSDTTKAVYTNVFYKGGKHLHYFQSGNVLLLIIGKSGLKYKSIPEENENGAINGVFHPDRGTIGQPVKLKIPVTSGDKVLLLSDDFLNNLRSGIFRGLELSEFCQKIASLEPEQILEIIRVIHKLNNLLTEKNRKEELKFPFNIIPESIKTIFLFISAYEKYQFTEKETLPENNLFTQHRAFNYFCELYYHYRTNKDYRNEAIEIINASTFMQILRNILSQAIEQIGEEIIIKINQTEQKIVYNQDLIERNSVSAIINNQEIVNEIKTLELNRGNLYDAHKTMVNKAGLLTIEILRLLQELSGPESLFCLAEIFSLQLNSGRIGETVRRYYKIIEQLKSSEKNPNELNSDDAQSKAEQKVQLAKIESELKNRLLTKKDDLTAVILEINKMDISDYEVYDVRKKEAILQKYMKGEIKFQSKKKQSIIVSSPDISKTVSFNPKELSENGLLDYRKTFINENFTDYES